MREIKFRGQNSFSFNWVVGSLLIKDETPYKIMTYTGYKHEVLPETIGQYIGLTDKNELEIFEGDITKDKYVIMWCEEKALFAEFFQNGYSKEWNIAKYPIDHRSIEIIGNMFDHPEILNT